MKIVCIGDSLTQGFGLNQSGSWVDGMSKQFGVVVSNCGIPGDTTGGMSDRFETEVMCSGATHVFIMGGSNDLLNGRMLHEVIENIGRMAERALQGGIKPVLMSPPPVNAFIENKTWFIDEDYDRINGILKQLATEIGFLADRLGVPFVDLYHHLSLEEWAPHFLMDGIHLRKSGQGIILEAITHVVGDELNEYCNEFHLIGEDLFHQGVGQDVGQDVGQGIGRGVACGLKVLKIEPLNKLDYLKAFAIHYRTKSGAEKKWEMISRGDVDRLSNEIFHGHSISDGSVVFATDRKKTHVVMLKEFRVGAGKYVYMLPAGLGDPHEEITATAIREFKEETGLDFEPIHVEPPRYVSIGVVNEKVSVVFGYYSGIPSKCHQADNEDAEILFVDKDEAVRLLNDEEVTIRTAMLLQDFFKLNPFFDDGC